MDTDGTPQPTALLRDGQEALARGAWEEARSAFEEALGQRDPARFTSGAADRSAETAEVLFGLGSALWWLGEIREAVRWWEQAYAAIRPIDPVQATNVALQLGFVYQANLGNDAARGILGADVRRAQRRDARLDDQHRPPDRAVRYDGRPSALDQRGNRLGASLQERYVREWLGAMVVGGVVTYDPSGKTYRLPPEHAACLTRAAGPDNLANVAQLVALLGNVEEGILQSFRNGGGVPYSAYTRWQELMAEDSAQVYGATLIGGTLPLVTGLIERLEGGITGADIGCGQGIALNLMAEAFPNSRFVGYDLSEAGIAAARKNAELQGLDNVRFEVKDATRLEERDRYHLITAFDVIHDLAHRAEVLKNIHRALEPGGTFLMVDPAASSQLHENLEHPMGPFLCTVSTMHCMTVSLEQGGVGLGTAWGEQSARRMLAEAGFSEVEVEHVEGDIFNNYFIARKG